MVLSVGMQLPVLSCSSRSCWCTFAPAKGCSPVLARGFPWGCSPEAAGCHHPVLGLGRVEFREDRDGPVGASWMQCPAMFLVMFNLSAWTKPVGSESENNFLLLDMIKKAEPAKGAKRRVRGQSCKIRKKVFTVTFRRSICRAGDPWQGQRKRQGSDLGQVHEPGQQCWL